jgi:hypothetical protein
MKTLHPMDNPCIMPEINHSEKIMPQNANVYYSYYYPNNPRHPIGEAVGLSAFERA